MSELIESPVRVEAAGQPPKTIEEFTGRASTGEERASVACMRSPAGWAEPGQRPEFDEYTVVLAGVVRAETRWALEAAQCNFTSGNYPITIMCPARSTAGRGPR